MKRNGLKILYLGDLEPGSTSLQRYRALQALGHSVLPLQAFPVRLSFAQRAGAWLYRHGWNAAGFHSVAINRLILHAGLGAGFDVLWMDKAVYVQAATIRALKEGRPGLTVIGYSPDHMAGRHNRSAAFMEHAQLYDLFVTTKSFDVPWLKAIGCHRVLFQGNAYDPGTHRPAKPSLERPGGVGFIGTYENARAADIAFLANHGISVVVFGNGWQRASLPSAVTVNGRAV
ncbi:MAG: hypothetical protein ACREKE_02075, partial [bacterium]